MVSMALATTSTLTPRSAARSRLTSMRSSGLFRRRSTSGDTMPGFCAISAMKAATTLLRFS